MLRSQLVFSRSQPILSALSLERRVAGISAMTVALYYATWLLQGSLARGGTGLMWLVVLYTSTTLLIFWAYGALIAMSWRGELHGRARLGALLVPVLLNLAFLAWVPSLSQDTMSYLAHGLLAQLPGHNPLLDPVQQVRESAFGTALSTHDWSTSPGITPYGILWTRVEILIAALCGTNITAGVLLFKVIAVLANLGSAFLIWKVLGRIHPSMQLTGTLAYLWNPLVLTELCAEGHNDAVMIFFSIAAVAAAITSRPGVSVIAQLLGALSKYICILFLPSQLVFLWRTQSDRRRLVLEVLIAVVVTTALLVLLYAPLWAGAHSLDGLTQRPYPFGAVTFFGLIRWLLKHTALSALAGAATAMLVTSLLCVLIIRCTARVRDAAGLVRSCAWISLAFLLVVSPDYWPWYACMAIAWICIADPKRWFWLVLLLSMAGRLTGPLDILRIEGHLGRELSKGLITGMGALLPLFALIMWEIMSRVRRSTEARPA